MRALELAAAAAHGRGVGPPVADATIAELVVAARGGNQAAFTTLYQRFHRAVHAVALARVGVSDAADVVQDVFARAWTRLDAVRDPAAFPGWLMTLARHRAIDRARLRPPPSDTTVEVAVAPVPTADTRMPAAPPEPRYWFSQVVEGCRISALIFARVAASVSRATIAARPPSRAHTGRLASSGLLPAV